MTEQLNSELLMTARLKSERLKSERLISEKSINNIFGKICQLPYLNNKNIIIRVRLGNSYGCVSIRSLVVRSLVVRSLFVQYVYQSLDLAAVKGTVAWDFQKFYSSALSLLGKNIFFEAKRSCLFEKTFLWKQN